MNISATADINCVDGSGGHTTRLVLDPEKRKITHLVVKSGLFAEERLVPIELVDDSTASEIWLSCTKDDLKQMPPFVRNEVIQPGEFSNSYPRDFLVTPSAVVQQRPVTIKREQIPEGEVALDRGASVNALDGHIGHVSEFLVIPPEHVISHLVAEEGHFWDKRPVAIPVSEIDHMDKDGVYLKITKDIVEALPVP